MQYLESIKQLLEAAWAMPEVQIIVYHSLVSLVAAITAALATNTFDLGKLWEFFGKKILPFSAMYLVSRLAGDVVLAGVLPAAVFVAIEAALLRAWWTAWRRYRDYQVLCLSYPNRCYVPYSKGHSMGKPIWGIQAEVAKKPSP